MPSLDVLMKLAKEQLGFVDAANHKARRKADGKFLSKDQPIYFQSIKGKISESNYPYLRVCRDHFLEVT